MASCATKSLLLYLLCGFWGCNARRISAASRSVEAPMHAQQSDKILTSSMAGPSTSAESGQLDTMPTFDELKAKIDCWETHSCPSTNDALPVEIYDETGARNSHAFSGEMRMNIQSSSTPGIIVDEYEAPDYPKVGYHVSIRLDS